MLLWWNWQTRHIQDVYFAGSSPAESTSVRQYDNLPSYASVAESADAPDLKSGVRDGVRVQFPSEAPCRGVAQLVEQRSPKPRCVCSNRITPANGLLDYVLCTLVNYMKSAKSLQVKHSWKIKEFTVIYFTEFYTIPYANGPGRLGCGLQIRQKLVRLQSFAPKALFAFQRKGASCFLCVSD